MKKISLLACILLFSTNLYSEDKLDILDKQSKEFFNAITGLEKNYLEEQVANIKTKANQSAINTVPQGENTSTNISLPQEIKISEEEYAKTVFEHENEMARLTTDFTRTKKLKNIKIKSMYSFNNKNYVVLKLDEKDDTNTDEEGNEVSFNIEGRYSRGDSILTHKIVNINTRTKTVELYKKLDDKYGYFIYLSNYGISVSDLKKKEKPALIKKEEIKKVNTKKDIKKAFEKVKTKNTNKSKELVTNNISECLYSVNKENLNVRNNPNLDAKILRILKINDEFTIQSKNGNWFHIDTIYKNKSGDVMVVGNQNNWLQAIENNIISDDKNCL